MGFSEALTLLAIDKFAIGLLIALAGYFLARLLEGFKGKQALQREIEALRNQTTLKHIQCQIEELYSPLLGLINQSGVVFDVARRKLKHMNGDPAGRISEADADTERYFREQYFLPLNKQMADLLRTKVHLILSEEMPPSFVAFLQHQAQFQCLHSLWSEKGIHSDEIQGIPWPVSFKDDVESALRELKQRYNDYLKRLEAIA